MDARTGFPYNKLQGRTLYLQVMDYDRFCRDDPIGEVCVPLSDVDLLRGETLYKTLQPCKGHTVSRPVNYRYHYVGTLKARVKERACNGLGG